MYSMAPLQTEVRGSHTTQSDPSPPWGKMGWFIHRAVLSQAQEDAFPDHHLSIHSYYYREP